jgi:hypothetical protein
MKTKLILLIISLFCLLYMQCQSRDNIQEKIKKTVIRSNEIPFDSTIKTIHVFVALCDNQYQGIVPVPDKIGKGQDPDNNLYWGCSMGMRTYFKNSKEWKFVQLQKRNDTILERIIFKHATKNIYLIADAYNGKYIESCTVDFLESTAGQLKDTLHINNKIIGICGNAKLMAYIGHDGLMDFNLHQSFTNADNRQRDCIILACISKKYFAPHLHQTKANPVVWTTGLMCPEAYTLHDALRAYTNNESVENVRNNAAVAYAKYQKCGVKAARNLLVSGW